MTAAGTRTRAVLVLSLLAVGCGGSSSDSPPPDPVIVPAPGLVAEGRHLFFQETFDGNGRTCGTCHPERGNFTLSPELIASLPPDDPLFVAERVPELAGLESPALMHGPRALILENVDGFDQPAVFRGVPHVFDLAATPPFGWSGSIASLEDFATAAVRQHFPRTLHREPGVDFRLPTEHERAALAAFMQSVVLPGVDAFDPGIVRSAAAERGRDVFFGDGRCSLCHVGPLFTDNGFFDTGVTQRPNNTVEPPECEPPCGAIGPREAGGGRAFNTPTLLGLANSAPYFHDNSAATIHDAVAHYSTPAFNGSAGAAFAGAIELTETEIDDVAAFLAALSAGGDGM